MNDRVRYEELSQRIQSSDELKKRFLSEPKSVLIEMGIDVPDSIIVKVHEDTATVKNFVIPVKFTDEDEASTSNPLFRKAIAKAYTDPSFKAQLIQNPKSAIAELTDKSLPEDLDIYVHENTPTLKHIVVTVAQNSEELSEDELEAVAGGGPILMGLRVD